jgi:Family of unknown function (DUF5686)/CarboxypepD_reg-like domain
MRILLSLLLLLFSQVVAAQKIYGTVFNSQGDLLPFASVTVKGTTKGASANDKAKFAFNVGAGKYTIICQHLGYTTSEKEVTVKEDTEVTFILTEQKLSLETVVITTGGEDPAYEVIRSAIKKRNYFLKQVSDFSCNLYSKDLVKFKALPKKVFGKKIAESDKKEMGVDSTGKGIVYLSESQSKVSIAKPDKFKMEVLSSRISGSDGFGFSFPAFISLYNNNVKIFTEKFNPRGFVSPIADGAINFYKYKFLGTIFENGKSISSIRVAPRRKYEPLFSGVINIIDEEWSIHSFDLTLTKTAQLEIVDTLQITQLHVPVDATIRRVKNQLIHFDFNQFGVKLGGNFVNVYSDYNITPNFSKKYFDNVMIKYDTGVNKKSVAYWDSTRAIPLEIEEQLDYKKKDSTFKASKDSAVSKRYFDSLNRAQRKIKPLDIFTKGITRFYNTQKNTYNWRIEPFVDLLSPNIEYNPAEGVAASLKARFSKFKRASRRGTGFTLATVLRYGFGNTHFNPSATLIFNTREQDMVTSRLKRYSIAISGGKRVSEFNKEGAFPPIRNTLSTLFYGKNYMKTYENYFASIGYTNRYENGLRIATSLLYEDRIPLENTSDYTFKKSRAINITPNYPYEKLAQQFDAHKAFIFNASISFKPGQRYIQFPNFKMPIGSKYPTFTLNYAKGFNGVLGSNVDFDKWKFTIQDDKNLKLAGAIKYKVGMGGFLNNKNVFIQDYQHFNGNQIIAASEYVNSFQLAPYYANSTIENFYVFGHVDHHFNGLLSNKIPLFRKLNWNFVAGSNAFYVNKDNNYVEVFGGIENILKLFRVDFVAGYSGSNVVTGFRIGAGGLLGGSISKGGDGGINLSF